MAFSNHKPGVEEPVVIAKDGPGGDKDTVTTHPAFGQIRAARVSGSASLYGSDFVHGHFVAITITRSEEHRHLSKHWYHGSLRDEVTEVWLSEAQWAEFVSAMNIGHGPPCTIKHVDGARLPDLPDPKQESDTFKDEMRKTLDTGRQRLKEMSKAIDEMPITAKAKKELHDRIHMIDMAFGSSPDFVADQFGKSVEKKMVKAKQEIIGYVSGAILSAGMKAIENGVLPLYLPGSTDAPPDEGGIDQKE